MKVSFRQTAGLALCILCLLYAVAARAATNAETSLLHRRPDLRGIEVWDRAALAWRPFAFPTGKILVLNFWSLNCEACLAEMALLTQAESRWSGRGVVFLTVADPPEQMQRDQIVDFWKRRFIEVPPGRSCPGMRTPPIQSSIALRCPLSLPPHDPGRNADDRLHASIPVRTQPLTLLVDPHGTVRQAFVGSLSIRPGELDEALDRLQAAVAAESCERTPGKSQALWQHR